MTEDSSITTLGKEMFSSLWERGQICLINHILVYIHMSIHIWRLHVGRVTKGQPMATNHHNQKTKSLCCPLVPHHIALLDLRFARGIGNEDYNKLDAVF